MPNEEVHVGDDWYLDENNDGDLIFYNSRKDEVVKAIDVITGAEDKKGNSLNNVSTLDSRVILSKHVINSIGLIGYWPGLAGSGTTLYDKSGKGNHGTINGANWASTVQGEETLSFDGKDDYVNLTSHMASLAVAPITVSAWFNLNDLTNPHGIIQIDFDWNAGENSGLSITHRPSKDGLRVYAYHPPDSTILDHTYLDSNYSTGQWVHIAVTISSTDSIIYIDGGSIYSSGTGDIGYDGTNYITIGSRSRNGEDSSLDGDPMDGTIDEVRVYDRALSTTEISNIYEKTRGLYGV